MPTRIAAILLLQSGGVARSTWTGTSSASCSSTGPPTCCSWNSTTGWAY